MKIIATVLDIVGDVALKVFAVGVSIIWIWFGVVLIQTGVLIPIVVGMSLIALWVALVADVVAESFDL